MGCTSSKVSNNDKNNNLVIPKIYNPPPYEYEKSTYMKRSPSNSSLHKGEYCITNLDNKFKRLINKNKGIVNLSTNMFKHNRNGYEYKMSLVPPYSFTNIKKKITINLKRNIDKENKLKLFFESVNQVNGYNWYIELEVNVPSNSITNDRYNGFDGIICRSTNEKYDGRKWAGNFHCWL